MVHAFFLLGLQSCWGWPKLKSCWGTLGRNSVSETRPAPRKAELGDGDIVLEISFELLDPVMLETTVPWTLRYRNMEGMMLFTEYFQLLVF